MKRTITTTLIAIMLCACMMFGLTACGGPTQDDIDNAVNEATAPLSERIAALEKSIAEREARIAAIEAEKATLEAEKATLEADKAALEADKAALEADKAALEADKAGLENCVKGVHERVNNVCRYCGEVLSIDATEMEPVILKEVIADLLAEGVTNITITLAPDADSDFFPGDDRNTMQYAIRTAIADSDAEDGSINLTIEGLKTVADEFLGRSSVYDSSIDDYVDLPAVTEVGSITLTDATEIGYSAFMDCTSLVSVFAPKVTVVNIEAFSGCTALNTLSLTTREELALGSIHYAKLVFGDPSISEQVSLILSADKQTDVTNDSFDGYTFKSVEYTCTDGGTEHAIGETVAYYWNNNYTVCSAGYTCTRCGVIDVIEAVNTNAEQTPDQNGTTISAVFTNEAFGTQTVTIGYTYDSESNTYSVWDAEGLNLWRLAVESDERTSLNLMADITLDTEGITVDENGRPSASNWTPVYSFRGTLNGNGYSIKDLRIVNDDNACFIFYTMSATIKDFSLVNPVVYGESTYTAALISQVAFGTKLINCHVRGGSVTGERNGVGGLVSVISFEPNYFYGCTNSAKLTGPDWVGGILGTANLTGNTFVACANTGEINTTGNYSGGIVGRAEESETLIGCYTTGGNICGGTEASLSGCYYLAESDSDGLDGTLAVATEAELNSDAVVNAMNAAIDSYIASGSSCSHKWSAGDTYPVPVAIE